MTKKKKTDKTAPAAEAPALTQDKNTAPAAAVSPEEPPEETAPAAAVSPEESPAEMFDDIPPADPTLQLMQIAFEAWLGKQLEGVMYVMTRTFTHHRRKEEYGTHMIFNALETLNRGKHAELLEELEAFRDTLFNELDGYIAERNAKR